MSETDEYFDKWTAALRRIRELEAALQNGFRVNREMEAEVERLRADLAHAILQLQPNVGGGRESGVDKSPASAEQPGVSRSAAANPAASDAEARRAGQAAYARSVREQKLAARKEG